jgi:hypothetical protein
MRADMHVPMLALALLLAIGLAARPAAAGELIRYRTPDGSVGFVDDEKRLPPGVEVVSRTPLERGAPPPPPPAADAAATPPAEPAPAARDAATAGGSAAPSDTDGADCETLADPIARTRCRGAREQRCGHYGLAPGCAPAQIASARDWCARSEALRAEIASVEDEADAARERHAACLRRSTWRRSCDSDEVEESERAARGAARRVQALEAQCHDEGCLPGWVREGCAFEPGA